MHKVTLQNGNALKISHMDWMTCSFTSLIAALKLLVKSQIAGQSAV